MTATARAVAFDMDGVLIDGMKYHIPAWQKAFQDYADLAVSDHSIYLREGLKSDELVDQVLAEAEIQLEKSQKEKLIKYREEYFKSIFKVEPIPGIHELIETIAHMNYAITLVTGTNTEVAQKVLKEMKIDQYFDAIIGEHDAKQGKPHPEPFEAVMKKLDIPADQLLVIENAPPGIAAAKRAGAICIAMEVYLDAEFLVHADIIVQKHAQIEELLLIEHAKTKGVGKWAFV